MGTIFESKVGAVLYCILSEGAVRRYLVLMNVSDIACISRAT